MLLDAIAEIGNREIILAPGDVHAEAANTRWLDAPSLERALLTVTEVVAAFRAAAGRLAARTPGRALLYVWHDERTTQLRCGVTSRPAHDLPFGSDYRLTGDLASIVATFLLTDPKEATAAELDLTVDDPGPPADRPVPVWTHPL